MKFWLLSLSLILGFGPVTIDSTDLYSITVKDLQGNVVPMSVFKGKILLIINVASECGYTDWHYKELVELQSQLSDQDFSVLAFPCNQFGNQEPLRNSGIARFVKNKYNVNFPVFSKLKVKGEQAHPLYRYLSQLAKKEPEWNFGKYLVSKAGRVLQFWNQEVSPLSIIHFIKKHLNMAITDQYEVYSVKEL